MEYVDWPDQPIPQPVIDLLARFYCLLDCPDPNSSRELAEEVFAPEAQWTINKRVMRGPSEITSYRTHNNEAVTPRRHRVTKLYVCNDRGDDVMMTGTFKQVGSSNIAENGTFCARCVVDDGETEVPRIVSWQMWMDNPPFGAGASPPRREKTPSSGILDTIGGR